MAIPNRLRELREARGEGLRECASVVGIDPAQLSKVERGIVGCSDEMKVTIAQHFGVSVGALFFPSCVENMETEVAR
jgi:transcriptional regulator with XRE-family HTH domain